MIFTSVITDKSKIWCRGFQPKDLDSGLRELSSILFPRGSCRYSMLTTAWLTSIQSCSSHKYFKKDNYYSITQPKYFMAILPDPSFPTRDKFEISTLVMFNVCSLRSPHLTIDASMQNCDHRDKGTFPRRFGPCISAETCPVIREFNLGSHKAPGLQFPSSRVAGGQ